MSSNRSPTVSEPPAGAPAVPEGEPRRRDHVLRELRGPYYAAVRDAWRLARADHDDSPASLERALGDYARDARARGIPVSTLLTSLDALVRPASGGDPALDYGRVREWAGTTVIRAYYRGD